MTQKPSVKVLVLHGAGLNMRGKVSIQKYGTMTLADYERAILGYAEEINNSPSATCRIELEFFQSNTEGEHIDRLYAAHDDPSIAAAVINPGGFSKGYRALALACEQMRYPVYEVHISNPAAGGVVSEIAPSVRGTVAGFGILGYMMVLQALSRTLVPPKPN